jgi:hypothetical protein
MARNPKYLVPAEMRVHAPINWDYHRNRDILERLRDEHKVREFYAERRLHLTSTPNDLAEETRILADAIAEIERLRGGGA